MSQKLPRLKRPARRRNRRERVEWPPKELLLPSLEELERLSNEVAETLMEPASILTASSATGTWGRSRPPERVPDHVEGDVSTG